MKLKVAPLLLCLANTLWIIGVTHHAQASSNLREAFRHPPEEAKPRGYWVWPQGHFDYATMRQELADFKARGLGGVDIFDLGVQDRRKVIPPGPGFLSPKQVDGIAFALEEAKRLGLRMGLIVSSSWNAGGTWTPPELAMMNLVAWRETNTGPMHFERVLPFPEVPTSFRKPYGSYPLSVPRDDAGEPLYRREVATLAYPLDAEGRLADVSGVQVLTERLDAAGKLSWDMPAGRWLIMRTVLVNFGQRLWLPSEGSQGLTMDHFSREATRHHFETVINRLQARIGPLRNTALERLYLASYEANAGVTWTPGFEQAFAVQNGYRIEPYLPALYGLTVVDKETTERFLHDYRKTVSELFINNLYREASRICREQGLLLCSEAGGPGAPLHDVPTEELKALGAVDVMRGEFWNGKTNQLTPDGFEELQVVKSIASAAHIYGHRIVEMESFTSHINWMEGPQIFKVLADRAFCEGMTRAVYHTMSHNLPEAGVPGWTYGAGSHMGTHLTWWEMSDPLHLYLARCSALLMQGEFVADVACYYGDDVPTFAHPKHERPGLGRGYDYDDLNTEMLLQAKVNSRGELVLPGGMSYRLLLLPSNEPRMSLNVLQKLDDLIRSGATVLGDKPTRTYGLRGYPADEQRLREIADRLWGASTPLPVDRKIGRGRLIAGKQAREVLMEEGFGPDFAVFPAASQKATDFIHRRTPEADIYFVRNTSEAPLRLDARFRVQNRRPEIWDPVTGRMTRTAVYRQEKEAVLMPLDLEPSGSIFVVFTAERQRSPQVIAVNRDAQVLFPGTMEKRTEFRCDSGNGGAMQFRGSHPGRYELTFKDGSRRTVTVEPDPAPLLVEGPWEVGFPRGWGVEVRQEFGELRSWVESTNAGVRDFSGTARYERAFTLPKERVVAGGQVVLDLGEVCEAARVWVNGREAGVSLFTPHRLEVTDLVRAGENYLVIEVANTWLNRLRADDALPESERKTHTNLTGPVGGKRWRDAEPMKSGLLGPVRLLFPREVVVQ